MKLEGTLWLHFTLNAFLTDGGGDGVAEQCVPISVTPSDTGHGAILGVA